MDLPMLGGGFLAGLPLIGFVAGKIGLDKALCVVAVPGLTLAVLVPATATPAQEIR